MSQEQWKEPANDEAQLPLGMGGGEADNFSDSPPGEKKAKVSGPTMILFGAFVSAIAVLYLVGMQNKPKPASASEAARENQATSAITELLQKNDKAQRLQGLFTDTNKLVKMFYAYLGTQKSAIPRLSHDPFGDDQPPAPAAVKETVAIVNRDPADAEKLRQIAEEFNTLKLQSVMTGRTSVAMINNRLVQVGNKLGDLTVISIQSDRVLLSYHKNVFELKQADGDVQR